MNAGPLIFLVLLGAVLWLLLIRPQRQRQAAQQALIAQVQPGEEVVTVGGILGVVKDVDDEEIRLEIAPGTEVRVAKQAISGVVRKDG
ncbi:MAG TPA: preprotein translocase subunit YajC [Gaiellaceae bacterium]|jgi:preprotein translocase subunit YajC